MTLDELIVKRDTIQRELAQGWEKYNELDALCSEVPTSYSAEWNRYVTDLNHQETYLIDLGNELSLVNGLIARAEGETLDDDTKPLEVQP